MSQNAAQHNGILKNIQVCLLVMNIVIIDINKEWFTAQISMPASVSVAAFKTAQNISFIIGLDGL